MKLEKIGHKKMKESFLKPNGMKSERTDAVEGQQLSISALFQGHPTVGYF